MNSALKILFFFCAFVGVTAFLAGESRAAGNIPESSPGWKALISGHEAAPPMLVAVDKNRQQLYVFERKSPLRIRREFVCTTGQMPGDKQVEGDLKTPEGVYFVERRLNSGLDFGMYGKEAYTLNYPNPVDKLRRKTGHGIWIHGRGQAVVPMETQGCVAMNNDDIAILGRRLLPGLPVALASQVAHIVEPSPEDKKIIRQLETKVREWAKAWTSRSVSMFDYYDPQSYTLAQDEDFAQFKAQKERLFKQLPWIDTKVQDIQVLQGPGYWVTWFFQDYKAPNLSSKGVRRLYWQADKKGELRIVGMEWLPSLDSVVTLARLDKLPGIPVTDASPAPPESGTTTMVAEAPQKSVPAPTPVQETTPAPEKPAGLQAAKPGTPAKKPESQAERAERLGTEGLKFVESWRQIWESGNIDQYAACYAKDAVQSGRRGREAIRAHKRKTWTEQGKPAKVSLTDVRVTVSKTELRADMHQVYRDKSGYSDKGVKTLVLKQEGQNWLIAREDWKAE